VRLAPDFADPIVGWRTWLVVRRPAGPRLASVVQRTVWEPRRELVCECLAPRRRLSFRRRPAHLQGSPDSGCSCGIYASTDAELAGQYVFSGEFECRPALARVIGLVSLWGRVLKCPRGWRAEFAYPARIYIPLHEDYAIWSTRVEELAFALTEYGVPVEVVSHRGERDLAHSLA
jgi:hypothetical protein